MNSVSVSEAISPAIAPPQAQLIVMDIAREVQKQTTVELLQKTVSKMSDTGNLLDQYA